MLNRAPAPSLCSWKSVRASHQCCGGRAEAKSNLCMDSVCILSPVVPANSLRPLRARGLEPVIPNSSKASSLRPVPCSRPSPSISRCSFKKTLTEHLSPKVQPGQTLRGQDWKCTELGGREQRGVWVACFGLIMGLGKIPVLFTTSCWEGESRRALMC